MKLCFLCQPKFYAILGIYELLVFMSLALSIRPHNIITIPLKRIETNASNLFESNIVVVGSVLYYLPICYFLKNHVSSKYLIPNSIQIYLF